MRRKAPRLKCRCGDTFPNLFAWLDHISVCPLATLKHNRPDRRNAR